MSFIARGLVRRTLATVAAVAAVAVVSLGIWVGSPLPRGLLEAGRGSSIRIEDRTGLLLRNTRAADGTSAVWVDYDHIDPDLINAFVATEDRRFWVHHGVDPRAILRAVRANLRPGGTVSGASTLTMQLARLLRNGRRDWGGKLEQALWALRIDAHLEKPDILEQYFNRVHLGQNVVGVAAASALYFGTAPSELSIGQAATLAGIAHAPSRDNPHVSVTRARARRDVALARMRRAALITRDDAAGARLEPLGGGARRAPFLAPHFTMRVLGSIPPGSRDAVIRTSLDASLQERVEAEVLHTVSTLRADGVAQASAVVLDNRSGQVLAWVGSPDFWAERNGQTDMVVSRRQPGSALKPFLYALAIDRGVTAATVLPDVQKSFATSTGPYSPRNYDRRFRGPVRVREALASSYNVPAVELAERMTAASLLSVLHAAGFESLDRDASHYGLGLALGNGDVTLVELANGYRALANDGEWRPWTWSPEYQPPSPRRVASPLASAIVLDILSDPAARMPGFGRNTPFDFPFAVAVKTGTSRHFTDNWAVGVTGGFTVAVWAGNFTGKPMQGVSGITGAGPLLHRVVLATAERYPPDVLTRPAEAGAVPLSVCRLSGLRATDRCSQLTEWFRPGTEPTRADDWERGGRPVLPVEYADWVATNPSMAGTGAVDLPRGVDERRLADRVAAPRQAGSSLVEERPRERFRILSPLDGDRYSLRPGSDPRFATIGLRATQADGVEWTVDGAPHAGTRWTLRPGTHTIEARSPAGSARVTIHVESRPDGGFE